MSWWPVPDSDDDVTGDGPADAVDEALLGMAKMRGDRSEALPSLPELLCALQIALSARNDIVQDAPPTPRVATREGAQAAAEAPADIADAVERAVAGNAEAFQRDLSRLPRTAEVLYTFTFSLGGEPETILGPPLPQWMTFILE